MPRDIYPFTYELIFIRHKKYLEIYETQMNISEGGLTAYLSYGIIRRMSLAITPEDIQDISVKDEGELLTYPPLTQAEDTFALAVIECGGNINSAYKMTFGADSPFPLARGKELLSKPQIALRIKEITDKIQDASLISMGAHLYELADIRDLAKTSGQLKVALSAERARGEVVGLYDVFASGGKNNTGPANIQINLVSKFDVNI
ncbi:MAG: hypothetical protein JW384_02751 [Nitrosomonadaceae bacterium]|nr:hypothetical protein [Nitrosomonadaceae bacterium]